VANTVYINTPPLHTIIRCLLTPRAPAPSALTRDKALPPFSLHPLSASASLRGFAPDQFLVTKPNFSRKSTTSLATLRWCSGHPGTPFRFAQIERSASPESAARLALFPMRSYHAQTGNGAHIGRIHREIRPSVYLIVFTCPRSRHVGPVLSERNGHPVAFDSHRNRKRHDLITAVNACSSGAAV
jgi:hypothetical protein